MRLSSSICSSLKLLISVLCAALIVAACTQNKERNTTQREATGKGNGGGTLHISQQEVDGVFAQLKPNLRMVFEALNYLLQAEKVSPKSTELADMPVLQKVLGAMTESSQTVFTDIDAENNFALQEAPCRDFRGHARAAAAVLLEVGGKICFSTKQIRATSVKNFDKAAQIFIIGLAAHEFVHHFVSTGNHAEDEKAAMELQNFVEQQLIRSLEVTAKDVISIDDSDYIARFYQQALDVYTSAIEQPRGGRP